MSTPPEVAAIAALVSKERQGVLSSAHERHGGWPFGSLVPYALSAEGDPILLLSDIAEHTHNLNAEPRASLLVSDPAARDRPQSAARVTLMGRAVRPTGPALEAAGAAYTERFPESKGYFSAHGFAIVVLAVERVRWIAGFGSMGWLDRAGWSAACAPADPLGTEAAGIVEHMNRDHATSVAELAAHYAKASGTAARMVGLDARGFDVEVTLADGARRVRIPFPAPATTPDAVRKAVMGMLSKARKG